MMLDPTTLGTTLGAVIAAVVVGAGGVVSGYVAARRKLGAVKVEDAEADVRVNELRQELERAREGRKRERELHEREREMTQRHIADVQRIAELTARVRHLESVLRQAGRLVPDDRREAMPSDMAPLDSGGQGDSK